MEQLLVCEHITKKIGDFILRDIHFGLEPGYILAVIGSNGAGKSTLVRTMLGSYKLYNHVEDYTEDTLLARGMSANKGDIFLGGYSVKKNMKGYKEQIAFIMNDCPFSMRLSAKENGKLYGAYYKDFNHGQYKELCEKYNVPFEIALKKLSRGEQIKMQLAFALARKAKLYVFDEPAGNLDVKFRDEFYVLMRELVSDGEKSIVYVTHLVEEIDMLADYVLWIEDGEQVGFGTLENLMDGYRLYFGEMNPIFSKESKLIQEEPEYRVVAIKENESHKEALLWCENGEFPERIKNDSRRATLKEIMYYEKEAKERRRR